MLSYKK